MQTTKTPSKEQVRAWLAQRRRDSAPLPTPQEVRVQLGWVLDNHLPAGKRASARKLKDAT
jgi:hypothetical protein